ncbi:MAG: type IV pilus modification protein PilV [Gammaproteobacteria bacterium]
MYRRRNPGYSAGFSMTEVLITLIIVMVGLLGIAGLQAKAQVAELESYQRAQALIVLSDIVDRMNINREATSCFAVTTDTTNGTPYIGTDGGAHLGTPTCAASTTNYNNLAIAAINEIDNFLKGTSEALAGGESAGAMIGARACISYDSTTELAGKPDTGLYTVIVTWQGMSDLIAPSNMDCAVGEYGNEAMRRAVSTTVRFAQLQ